MSISNYKGRRSVSFEKGQNVFIRNYSNVNKKSWSPAIIEDKMGPRSYWCIMSTGRIIKRHTDQIRAGVEDNKNIEIEDSKNIEIEDSKNIENSAELPTCSNESNSISAVEQPFHENNNNNININ